MKILYPIIKTGGGSDTYIEILNDYMNKLGINTKIKYYHPFSGLALPLIKLFFKKFENYDIIHSNEGCGFAFKKNNPLIVTVHHLVFNPIYQKYTSRSQKIFHKILFLNIKKSLDSADHIVAVSRNTKREIERIYGITDIKVIYNGINNNIFRPLNIQNKNPYPDKIKLLFVGNLTKRKGFDLLPKIMKALDDRFILYYTSGLRIKMRFSNNKMICLGRLKLSELVRMYNLSDIFIAPSRLEGFGYTVAEAMACGKPVVATNYSSLPELVINEKGGFLCEIDNIKDFVNRINYLADDENLRIRMGKFNRERINTFFSLDRMGNEYVNLYKKAS